MKKRTATLLYLIAGLLILSVTTCARLEDALPGIIDDREPDPSAAEGTRHSPAVRPAIR